MYLQPFKSLGSICYKSKLLRSLGSLDPNLRCHETVLVHLKKLPKLLQVDAIDIDAYTSEVTHFTTSTFPEYDKEEQLDAWYSKNVFGSDKYSNLSQIVKTVLSIFRGPRVESPFNIMDDIIDNRSTRMKVNTFSSIQTIKYGLKARNHCSKTTFMKKNFRYDSVDPQLVHNLLLAHSEHIKEQEAARKLLQDKRFELGVCDQRKATKASKKVKEWNEVLAKTYKPPILPPVEVAASVHNEEPIQINEPQVDVPEPIQEPVKAVVKKSKKRQSSLMQHFVADKHSKL